MFFVHDATHKFKKGFRIKYSMLISGSYHYKQFWTHWIYLRILILIWISVLHIFSFMPNLFSHNKGHFKNSRNLIKILFLNFHSGFPKRNLYVDLKCTASTSVLRITEMKYCNLSKTFKNRKHMLILININMVSVNVHFERINLIIYIF